MTTKLNECHIFIFIVLVNTQLGLHVHETTFKLLHTSFMRKYEYQPCNWKILC